MFGEDVRHLLGARVPGDHARQTRSHDLVADVLAGLPEPRVLDLGCGDGRSVDLFRALAPTATWLGVDIEGSAEVAARTRTDAEFRTFDGCNIPSPDGSVDLVFCHQVLEHVRAPAPLLADVARVLAPGGHLVGSTSQLEPFHSQSTANPTPYGLMLVLEEAGLPVLQMRPGIDGLTLIVRRGLGGPRVLERFWTRESPLNRVIDLYGRLTGMDTADVNAAKLVLCGQFAFVARKPS